MLVLFCSKHSQWMQSHMNLTVGGGTVSGHLNSDCSHNGCSILQAGCNRTFCSLSFCYLWTALLASRPPPLVLFPCTEDLGVIAVSNTLGCQHEGHGFMLPPNPVWKMNSGFQVHPAWFQEKFWEAKVVIVILITSLIKCRLVMKNMELLYERFSKQTLCITAPSHEQDPYVSW